MTPAQTDVTPTDVTSTDVTQSPQPTPAVLIAPGFHDPTLTQQLMRSLPATTQPYILSAFPADALGMLQEIVTCYGDPSQKKSAQPALIALGFSAGVVGLAGALRLWQQRGGSVRRLLAVDGWGVPLWGLPVSRLSHDGFTHWSSLPLGAGAVNFVADPPVPHLQLWGSPERVCGWQVYGWHGSDRSGLRTTAADFLRSQIRTSASHCSR